MPAMSTSKRATVYFAPETHRRLRVKAAETGGTLSELVERAATAYLDGMEGDLRLFEERAGEPSLPLATVLAELERRDAR